MRATPNVIATYGYSQKSRISIAAKLLTNCYDKDRDYFAKCLTEEVKRMKNTVCIEEKKGNPVHCENYMQNAISTLCQFVRDANICESRPITFVGLNTPKPTTPTKPTTTPKPTTILTTEVASTTSAPFATGTFLGGVLAGALASALLMLLICCLCKKKSSDEGRTDPEKGNKRKLKKKKTVTGSSGTTKHSGSKAKTKTKSGTIHKKKKKGKKGKKETKTRTSTNTASGY